MNQVKPESQSGSIPEPRSTPADKPTDKPVWEAPKMEDVSEQVMAQPYIRFT